MYAEARVRGDGDGKASVAAIGAYFDHQHLYLDRYTVAKQTKAKSLTFRVYATPYEWTDVRVEWSGKPEGTYEEARYDRI